MPASSLPLLLALAQAAPSPGTPAATATPAPAPTAAPAAPAPAPAPAPVLSSGVTDTASPVAPAAPVTPVATQEKTTAREVGPFFVEDLPEETQFAGGPRRNDPPRLSIGRGKFCFVDDAACKVSLIATADVGVGVNVIRSTDYAFSQFGFRGGIVTKPLTLVKNSSGWHPWGLGIGAGWSLGTGNPGAEGMHPSAATPSFRVFLVNQLWLSQKRNGFNLGLDFGIVRSVIRSGENYVPVIGTHAGVSANFGGWGGLFLSGDFLYQDTRVIFGFRGHGVAAGPAIGLVLLGLLAGGAFQ